MNPWILAIRPKTLPAAIAPVLIGTAMAFGDGLFHAPSALMALSAALCIQIGTNLANDYFDFKKGADTADRKGPMRVTQAGLIKPQTVFWASMFFFVLAALSSIYLIHRGGLMYLDHRGGFDHIRDTLYGRAQSLWVIWGWEIFLC